jgi:hypothetical protein
MGNIAQEVLQLDNVLLHQLIAKIERVSLVVETLQVELQQKTKPYMSFSEVVSFTGYGSTWIKNHKTELGGRKVGGGLRFKRETVIEFMDQYEVKRS